MDKWLKIRDNKIIKIQNTYTKPRENVKAIEKKARLGRPSRHAARECVLALNDAGHQVIKL